MLPLYLQDLATEGVRDPSSSGDIQTRDASGRADFPCRGCLHGPSLQYNKLQSSTVLSGLSLHYAWDLFACCIRLKRRRHGALKNACIVFYDLSDRRLHRPWCLQVLSFSYPD